VPDLIADNFHAGFRSHNPHQVAFVRMPCCPLGRIGEPGHDRLGIGLVHSEPGPAAAGHDRRKALEDLWT